MLNSAPTRPSLFYPCILAYFVSNIENPEDVRYYPWEVYYLSLCFAGYWTRTVAEVEGEEGSCPIWIIEIKFIFTDFLKLLWLSVKIPYIVSYDFKFKFYINELVNLVLFVKIIKLRRVFSTIRDVYMSISLTLTSVSCIYNHDHWLCFESSKFLKKIWLNQIYSCGEVQMKERKVLRTECLINFFPEEKRNRNKSYTE